MGDSERESSERGEVAGVVSVVVGDWGGVRADRVVESRYDGGIAGSAQRVLVGVGVGDMDSVDSACLLHDDESKYDGGIAGSAHSDLSNFGPVGEKTNAGADADRVGVRSGVFTAGGELLAGGGASFAAALRLIFARLCS